MKQYCRYCGHACLQDDNIFYCSAKEKLYNGTKAKHVNKCRDFGYCGVDLFDITKEYKPRDKELLKQASSGKQISIFDSEV